MIRVRRAIPLLILLVVAFALPRETHAGGPAELWPGALPDTTHISFARDSRYFDWGAGSAIPDYVRRQTRASDALVPDQDLWSANGDVLDIARAGNTLYIAGSFRSVGKNPGGLVPTNASTGEVLSTLPKVAGRVLTVVHDGRGGWYLGGDFKSVGGKERLGLAQLRADGSLTDWAPSVTGSPGYLEEPRVVSITVVGERVFVGGGFREVGGQSRKNLGCVDATTGAVLDWDPNIGDGEVFAVTANDTAVFVGGYFFEIGGQARSCLASVDAGTGNVKDWRPEAQGLVWTLLLNADTLFVGGRFGRIGGVTRPHLAAVDIRSGTLFPFDAQLSGDYVPNVTWPFVGALVLVGDTLYAGGNFTSVGGQPRPTVAALNATTGSLLAWDPPVFGIGSPGLGARPCYALFVSGRALYLGGGFVTVGDSSRPFSAGLDRVTGRPTDWNPKADSDVRTIARLGDAIVVGGNFNLIGEWRHRAGLAAIDLSTGQLKPWNPNPNGGTCTAIAIQDGRVFVSGDFNAIGGDPQPRTRLAALDTLNGEATAWNPGANGNVSSFLLVGDTLYAGGYFTNVAGATRRYLAAFDTNNGELTTWDPNADWPVRALTISGNTIFAGGLFTHVGGYRREGVAAIDRYSGAVFPRFNPYTTGGGYVAALAAAGNRLFVGGGFDQIGRQPRSALAALDTATGNATTWNPVLDNWSNPMPSLRALALRDSTLVIGGSFSAVGSQPRICLAEVDTSTAEATAWNPDANGPVWSLLADAGSVYAGGGFTRAGGIPAMGIVAFSPPLPPQPPPAPEPPPSRLAIARLWPNPAADRITLGIAVPEAAAVNLDVMDLSGRRVASVLHQVPIAAGTREFSIPTNGWPSGVYFCRLQSAGRSVTRRILVVR